MVQMAPNRATHHIFQVSDLGNYGSEEFILNHYSNDTEPSQLICSVNQITDFYVMETLVVNR